MSSWKFLLSVSSVFEYLLMKKKLKPDISLAVNKKRLHTGWYTAMLFPACVNSRNCYDYRFLKCRIYSLWIMQNYGLFYLILIIWKHEHLSSYCLWKIILYALVYTFPLSIFLCSVSVSLLHNFSSDSQTCISLTILIKTTWHVTHHPFV